MKIKYTLTISLLLVSIIAWGDNFWQKQDFMELSVVEKKWGTQKFNPKKFKSANFESRAQMTAYLIKSKAYIGKPLSKVFSDLGPSTGYFSNDSIPAYAIGNINEKPDELWQIIFLPEKTSQKVEHVKVHKKCCYKK